ncbi:MAG: electron transfer flavoprotein subunit alpha/FixB family protein, partial [Flavobacteriales bacterium]|nr:electron transfer flavoprotein subunit alpha/FixB family protein [Flavobacteriales bacterium]
LTYGADLAGKLSTKCGGICIGSISENLGKYGADKTICVSGNGLESFTPETYSFVISEIAKQQNASVVIFSGSYTGKSIAPQVAIKLNASLSTGVVALPDTSQGFAVRKSCFSNKAFTGVSHHADVKVISIIPNSYEIKSFDKNAEVSQLNMDATSSIKSKSLKVDKVQGKIPLTEAELVVSAGRGMKGPENWGMIEELADILGAATACSKPVADMDWRPHNEHVGQTGISIKPNLYIAVGISGAIQHLAGVSSSKVICVINTDPEAPFFKAADYGIVGDAFEVLPKLIERAKQLKAE